MAQVRHLVLLLLCGVCAVLGQDDESCAPDNADPGELAEMNIFQTVVLEREGITEDDVKKQVMSTASDEMQMIAKKEVEYMEEMEAGESSIDFTPAVPNTDATSARLADFELRAFVPVCPYRYYWLRNYKWFFYNGARNYCWAYYPIYVTSCTNRYCNWWFTNPYTVYFYYRCFPQYRYIWIWARCATYQDNQWVWSSQYVRRAVPRGCSCKRYFNPILTARQCPATSPPRDA